MHRDVKEVTVKSFSIAMGIKRPGFQLLSLIPPTSSSSTEQTFDDTLCLLPFQLGTYVLLYAPLAGASLLVLLLSNVCRVNTPGEQPTQAPTILPLRAATVSPSTHSSGWGLNLAPANPTLRKHDESQEETDEAAFMLPPPTPGIAITSKEHRSRTRTFSLGGRKMVLNLTALRHLLSYVFGCCMSSDAVHGRRRTRALHGFLADVAGVAWLPLALFVGMLWWFL